MKISTPDNAAIASLAATPRTPAAAAGGASEGFSQALDAAAATSEARDTEAWKAAEQFVATALVTPLLAELREQPLDTKLFHGGHGEDAFRQQLDTILADRIVQSKQFPIVETVYRQIAATRGNERATPAAPGVDARG